MQVYYLSIVNEKWTETISIKDEVGSFPACCADWVVCYIIQKKKKEIFARSSFFKITSINSRQDKSALKYRLQALTLLTSTQCEGEYIHFPCIVMGPCRNCLIGD